MKKHPNKFEGVRLTNDIPVAEWIASFPTESEQSLAEAAVQDCLDNGYQLSEIKLKFTMSSLRRNNPNCTSIDDTNSSDNKQVVYVERPKKKRGCTFALLATLLIILVAFFSNPDFNKHQEQVKQTVVSMAKSEVMSNDNPFVVLFGGFVIEKFADALVCSNIVYHNYFLFSTTSIDLKDDQKTISFGAFGKVFTFSKEDIKEVARENSEKTKTDKE